MSRPPISSENLSPTLNLCECHDGWWLYDKTQGMNLGMRAPSREAALLEALAFYQRRLEQTENAWKRLAGKIAAVEKILCDEDDEE